MSNEIHIIARAVIIADNHILLCKHVRSEPNFYFLPGGHVEHWEDAKTTLIRELKEETGLIVEVKRFLGCLEFRFQHKQEKPRCHNHEYNFIFEAICNQVTKALDPVKSLEENLEIAWVSLSDLEKIDLKPEALKILLPKFYSMNMDQAFESSAIYP